MALGNDYVEIRVDGWRLSQCCRRPLPCGAEDIGTWQTILEIMSASAVFVNSWLIAFTGDFFAGWPMADRWWVFLLIEHVLLFFKFLLEVLIDDIPPDVRLQIQRSEFLNRKLLGNEEDEEIDMGMGEEPEDGPDLTVYKAVDSGALPGPWPLLGCSACVLPWPTTG